MAVGGLLAAMRKLKTKLSEHRFLFLGAGEVGTADGRGGGGEEEGEVGTETGRGEGRAVMGQSPRSVEWPRLSLVLFEVKCNGTGSDVG